MGVETLARWAKKKGIDLLGTGDFTHPTYFAELRSKLEPTGNGLFQLKKGDQGVQYILTTEVSNIYSQNGKVKRIHNLIFAPSFEVVEVIRSKLGNLGKLSSDGRPIFSFTAKELVKMILDISSDCLIIPAHAWTPWFSIFGANSGFDSIEECFGEMSPYIHAIETGLSSDPPIPMPIHRIDWEGRPMPSIVNWIIKRSSRPFERKTERSFSSPLNFFQRKESIITMAIANAG
jgi:PHP family Zn ribbon phosphoesterase